VNSDFLVFSYPFVVEEFGNLRSVVSRKLDEVGGVLFVYFYRAVAIEFLFYELVPF
jgi:hypothetical protein